MHDDFTEEWSKRAADKFDLKVQSGRTLIVENWRSFRAPLCAWLVSSGHYSSDGKVLSVELWGDESLVTRFEQTLGALVLCAEVTLPCAPLKKGDTLPEIVWEGLESARYLLFTPHAHEPVLLRLALRAAVQEEKARLLCCLPPLREYGIIRGPASMAGTLSLLALTGVLLIASPWILAGALTAAATGKFGDTALACYGLAFTALVVRWVKKLVRDGDDSTSSSPERRALHAWQRLDDRYTRWTTTGAGAKAFLEDMLRRGFNVPLIAIDLCDALTANAFPISAPVSKKVETVSR